MVRNVKRNAFATGMQDTRDMRPLESTEPDSATPVAQSSREPSGATQAAPLSREPAHAAADTGDMGRAAEHRPPKEKRIGSNVTVENWRAWKLKSIEYGTRQAVLLNAAMDYCFQQGHFDPSLIDKYEQGE